MNTLYWLVTITDRPTTDAFLKLYKSFGVDVSLRTVGAGTAVQETLSTLGLEKTEKAVLFAIITADSWPRIQKALRRQMRIDVPGTGIAFIVPVSSIGGKRALLFLTEHQTLELKEESTLKDTRYDLLLVIANQGYTGSIMDAARAEGAGGGTVLHAKGTGMEGAARFLGVDLVNEKEMVFIVARSSEKNQIMKAIMAGADPKAGAIVFSLPVTDTAGLRLLDEDEMITWPDNNPEDWFYADMQEATNSHDYTWVTVSGDKVEKWTEKLEQRDWAALEHAWSTAHSAPGGEVTK